jgi:hypothetical protein
MPHLDIVLMNVTLDMNNVILDILRNKKGVTVKLRALTQTRQRLTKRVIDPAPPAATLPGFHKLIFSHVLALHVLNLPIFMARFPLPPAAHVIAYHTGHCLLRWSFVSRAYQPQITS